MRCGRHVGNLWSRFIVAAIRRSTGYMLPWKECGQSLCDEVHEPSGVSGARHWSL